MYIGFHLGQRNGLSQDDDDLNNDNDDDDCDDDEDKAVDDSDDDDDGDHCGADDEGICKNQDYDVVNDDIYDNYGCRDVNNVTL